jgi:hypothetical protein
MISQKYQTFARTLVNKLMAIRVAYQPWEHTNPVNEWKTYGKLEIEEGTESVAGLGAEGWTDRLYKRLVRSKNRVVALGVKTAQFIETKSKALYTKVKSWVRENPAKAVIIAFFGVPVAIAQLPNLVQLTAVAGTTAATLVVAKEAVQVVAETLHEEIVKPAWDVAKWALVIGGGIFLVWAFRDVLFEGEGT